jgi:hypothetical protein
MYAGAHNLVRRGVEHAMTYAGKDGEVNLEVNFKLDLPSWAVAILAVTALAYCAIMFTVCWSLPFIPCNNY